MAQVTQLLSFSTEGQSLWSPGAAIPLSIDTGDMLITSTGFSTDVGASLLGNGFEATAYVDVEIGLFAYASLGETGSFDSNLDLFVDVGLPGGLLIDRTDRGASGAGPGTFTLDFSSYQVVLGSLQTSGFEIAPAAGVHLILKLEAGLRNGSYFHWFGDGEFGDLKLLDVDFSEPLDSSIPLIEVTAATPELTLELTKGVELFATLPTGADTEASKVFAPGESIEIQADGASSDPFLGLTADLDELLVRFGSKIPGVGLVLKGLGETIFAEHEFDLHDYVPFIPAGKFTLGATVLDIQAVSGFTVTEKNKIDFGGSDSIPNVEITVRSDNGTPDFAGDDKTDRTTLGGNVSLARPVFDPTKTGPSAVAELGDITVHTTYALTDVEFSHSVGLGINSKLTIEALKAELTGAWVPSALQFSFGPLLSLEIPDGGFTIDLFDVPLPPFTLADDAFNQVEAEYKIFYTNLLAPSQRSEADLEKENARQAVIDYRVSRLENAAQTLDDFSDLFGGQTRQATTLIAGTNLTDPVLPAGDPVVWIWDAGVTARINKLKGAEDFFIAAPGDAPDVPDGNLRVAMTSNVFSTAPADLFQTNTNLANRNLTELAIGFDDNDAATFRFLQAMGTSAAGAGIYMWDHQGSDAFDTLTTLVPVEVRGGKFADAILFFDDAQNFPFGQIFDGGANEDGYDRFLANFKASHPTVAIDWDLNAAATTGQGVELANGVNVINVEALTLITGDRDDTIVTHVFQDSLFLEGGDDVVVLTRDDAGDFVDLNAGDDYIRIELGGAGNDNIFGGAGFDSAEVFAAEDAQDGLRVQVVVNNTNFFGIGAGAAFDASMSEIVSLLSGYSERVLRGTDVPQQDRTGGGDQNGDFVEYSQAVTGGRTRVQLNTTVEDLSVRGADKFNDLIMFTGGSVYDGGTSLSDTFIADLRYYEETRDLAGGISLDGRGDRSADTAGAISFGSDISVRGFERFAIYATRDTDRLSGGALSDFLHGAGGDDVLWGGDDSAADLLEGGDGDDTFFWSDNGADQIHGAQLLAGNPEFDTDTLIASAGATTTGGLRYAFFDNLGLLDGTNRFLRDGAPNAFTTDTDITGLLQAMDLAADTDAATGLAFGSNDPDDFMLFAGIDRVNLTATDAGNDLLIYQGGATYVAGETSNDRDTFVADFSDQAASIELMLAKDDAGDHLLANGVLVQGIDRLVIKAGSGNDVIHGERFDDYIDGGDGSDRLFGGDGDDIIRAGAGDDVVYWSVDGDDLAEGGDGEDRLIVGGVDPNMQGRALGVLLDRGEATEFSHVGGDLVTQGVEALLFALAGATRFEIQAAPETERPFDTVALEYSGFERIDVVGSGSESDLIFYDGGDLYFGGDGAAVDLFVANLSQTGIDYRFDTGFEAFADGAADEDFINAYDIGNGTRIGGFERFGLALGSGDDSVIGGAHSDVLLGGDGDDTLVSGGASTDANVAEVIDGGAGNDVMTYRSGVVGITGGTGDRDRVTMDTQASAVSLRISDGVGLDLQYGTADLTNHAAMQAFVTDISDFASLGLQFEAGANIARLTEVEEVKTNGSAEGDVVVGMTGRSQLFTGAGDDVLLSRGGDDLLVGGAGRDRYVLTREFGSDVIAAETSGGGALHFVGTDLAELTFADDGGDLLVTRGDNALRVLDYFDNGGLNFQIFTDDRTEGAAVPDEPTGGSDPARRTVEGTVNDDKLLEVSDGIDIYSARDGDDEMRGSAGADVFDGGGGNDLVSYADLNAGVSIDLQGYRGTGGAADGDVFAGVEGIIAGQQASTLLGDASDNFFGGSPSGDTIDGRGGDDLLIGLEGNDSIAGSDGDDMVFGDEGRDTVGGGAGDDYVDGGDGRDRVSGGAGDDTLTGGAGNDTVSGGAGDDILFYGGQDQQETEAFDDGLDMLDGGDGIDMLDFERFGSAVGVDLRASTGTVRTDDDDSFDQIGAGRVLADVTGVEDVTGSVFADRLTGTDGDNYLAGGDGDDTLTGLGGDDTLVGENGLDVVDYSAATGFGVFFDLTGEFGDPIATGGGIGADTLIDIEGAIGSRFADGFIFDDSQNTARGGAGDDQIDTRGGDDLLQGDAGADILRGGDGVDVYSVRDAAGGARVNLFAGLFRDGDGSEDVVDGVEAVQGSAHDDTITGDQGENALLGGAGNDAIDGFGGADFLDGGAGNDTLTAGAPGRVLIKAASQRTNLSEDALSLMPYFSLTAVTGIENATTIPHATVFGASSGSRDLFSFEAKAGDIVTVDIDRTNAFHDTTIALRLRDLEFTQNDNGPGLDAGSSSATDSFFTYEINFDGTYEIEVASVERDGNGEPTGNRGEPTARDSFVMHVSLTNAQVTPVPDGSVLFGAAGDDVLRGNIGNDTLGGGAGADTLIASSGADVLDGGSGADMLNGGQSGDLYFIDDTGDVIIETAATGGIDRAVSTVDFSFGAAHLEELALDGDGNINATGNDFAQYIMGSRGNNVIGARGGDDLIEAGAGDDTVNGGTGADTLNGGPGSDVLVVDNAGDRVAESRRWEGVDTVIASVDFRMGRAHIEDLILRDDARLGAGNGLKNTITGNVADNILDGGKNVDTLIGGAGDDIYLLRAPGDNAVEAAGEGTDTVRAFRSIALDDNIENLFIQTLRNADGVGINGVNGIGNTLANTIVGNPFNNTLSGREGSDTLRGQAGADRFVFDRAVGPNNIDSILDFNAAEGDKLMLKLSIFGSGLAQGTMRAGNFALGTQAQDANDRIAFDAATGRLFVDLDGAGGRDAIHFATLENGASVTAGDILLF